MKTRVQKTIVIIGCGNVAWHVAKHLVSLKSFRVSVYNHQDNSALQAFKKELKCRTEAGFANISADADAYFICVTDRFISHVTEALHIKNPKAILVHTSGSAKRTDLGDKMFTTGVFYPLQSFSKSAEINWQKVPVIIEAGNRNAEKSIADLAGLFSKRVITLGYRDRLRLHLAAVLVNNFTNALYVSAFDLLGESKAGNELHFKLLLPLIGQTTSNIETMKPREAQTGPARRGDEAVMKKHLDLIAKQEDLRKIYKQLSRLIVKQQKKNNA